MAEKLKPAVPASPEQDDYWSLTRQPLHSLLFLVPLLGLYELGVLGLVDRGGETVRNGADYWMRLALQHAGLEQPNLLPAIVAGVLVLWQLGGRHRWSVYPSTLIGMLAESVLFGGCLIVIGQVQDLAFRYCQQHIAGFPAAAIELPKSAALSRVVCYLGAGIYEEVLFRLALLPVIYVVLRCILIPRGAALFLAIVASGLVFSAAHYFGPAAEPFAVFSFTFRALAGVFFGMLFVMRGFGIAVGAHTAYDLLVGVLLPLPAEWGFG